MLIHKYASDDFERAYRKAFWNKVTAWLTGDPNTLLPFDELRNQMPIKGQHYLGLQQIPIKLIVGSLGRYRDFDREFLPRQTHTRGRWENIDRAHYQQVSLPPVELYKMGEIYFVRDGNHRISVARGWGQDLIDAYVTEILIPVPLTPEMDADEVLLQKELAMFLEKTKLSEFDENISITCKISGQYDILLEHISFHRWLLGEQRQQEISIQDAAISWFLNVYQPLVVIIEKHDIIHEFPKLTVTDLYLWLVKYLWYLSVIYREEGDKGIDDEAAGDKAAEKLFKEVPQRKVARLIKALKDAEWVQKFILQQERYSFAIKTRLHEYRPDAQIDMTVIGQYDILEKHISVHRWFLGEHWKSEVSYSDAVISWYDNIYYPLINLIREQKIMDHFPGRTETDLYLWILEKQSDIKAEYGQEVSVTEAAAALEDNQEAEKDTKPE